METVGLFARLLQANFKPLAVVVQTCGDLIFVNFSMPIIEIRALNSCQREIVVTHVSCFGIPGSSLGSGHLY
jgi:hypothetical protein